MRCPTTLHSRSARSRSLGQVLRAVVGRRWEFHLEKKGPELIIDMTVYKYIYIYMICIHIYTDRI